MSLKCGIVGLPNVGKSTLFNALTQAGIAAENYPFCTIEPNLGVVKDVVDEWHHGDGTPTLRVNAPPIYAITSLSVNDIPLSAGDYVVFPTYIQLKGQVFPAGLLNVRISYQSGKANDDQVIRLVAGVPLYNTPAGGLPDYGGLQEGGLVYIARPGDSLARIAYLYHTTVSELRRYNPTIGDDLIIQVGQAIQMPPDARRDKGWVGISTRIASPPSHHIPVPSLLHRRAHVLAVDLEERAAVTVHGGLRAPRCADRTDGAARVGDAGPRAGAGRR